MMRNKRFVDESEGLLSLQELAQIKSSNMYDDTIRLIIQAGQGKELNIAEFVDVGDFLLTRFSLDTGTRPGPLNNSTLEEFLSGKVKDGCKVMLEENISEPKPARLSAQCYQNYTSL